MMSTAEQDYDHEYEENQPHDTCPRCGRYYDEIDFDYQSCTKCGWDQDKEKFDPKVKREPVEDDFLNGDADILTGRWY